MVDCELYDDEGTLVDTITVDIADCAPVLLRRNDVIYRPFLFDFKDRTVAKCLPVEVFDV